MAKTWVPEVLAGLAFFLMLLVSGCNGETVYRHCERYFHDQEKGSACLIGYRFAERTGTLLESDKFCSDCFLDGSHCPGIENGDGYDVIARNAADEANQRVDLYTACYKGAQFQLQQARD